MTTTAHLTHHARSAAPAGIAGAVIAMTLSALGAHDWPEIAVEAGLIAVGTAVVFGLVVPRALRKDSAGGTALGLSVPAALLVVPAFWAGLPLVLGLGGLVVGSAGRTARTGAGKCIAAVVLGTLAVVAYAAIYVADMGVGGSRGFLVD